MLTMTKFYHLLWRNKTVEDNNTIKKVGYNISKYTKKPKTIAVCWTVAIANFIVMLLVYGLVFISIIKGCQKVWEIKDFFIYLADEGDMSTVYGFGFLGILVVLGYKVIKWILGILTKWVFTKFRDAITLYKYTVEVNDKDSNTVFDPVVIESYRTLTDDEVMEKVIPKIIKASIDDMSKIIFK